jgi:hypothetical protein
MNERTAKLLRKWAAQTKKSDVEVKRWWNEMTAEQRTRERTRIQKALAKEE